MNKILLVRNDKIGDFMLAWPSFALLKQSMPGFEMVALVPPYTKALAESCPYLDRVIVDAGKTTSKSEKESLIQKLKAEGFDASICFFSDTYNAQLVWQAGIKKRYAPATKLCQLLYNKRLKQKRSKSRKPEFEYNLDLAEYFLQDNGFLKDNGIKGCEIQTPYWSFQSEVLAEQRAKLASQLQIDAQKCWVFVHPGTGGSANGLKVEQYAQLILAMRQASMDFECVITAGPGEQDIAQSLWRALQSLKLTAVVYDNNEGLIDFSRSLACANLFAAGSTGPLHIAGALDVPTIGFYPSKRSSTPLRWRTLNSTAHHRAFSPPQATADDLGSINMDEVTAQVIPWVRGLGFGSTGQCI